MFSYSGADQRLSTQINFSHVSQNQRLKASVGNIFSYTHSDLVSVPGSIIRPPDAPEIFDANGNLNYSGWAPVSDFFPFSQLLQPYASKTYNLNTHFDLAYELLNGLSVSVSGGYANTNLSNTLSIPIVSQDPNSNPKGTGQFGTGTKSNVIIEPQINYKRLIGNGQLTALFGGSYQSITQTGRNIFGFGYTNDNLLNSITGATSTVSYDGSTPYKYLALFGRVNYNWRSKYILNTSIRRDGSSRFGNGKQFGNFWSIGAAWIFTEEQWLKNNVTFLSFGKLRGSYGLTGSDVIPDYEYLTTWSANNIRPYQSTPAYVPTKLANPDLHWQTNRKLELAMDLGFLKDRITIEFAFYRNICGDQLAQQTLPDITGFDAITVNFPATIQNTGLEAIVTAKLIDKKDIDWSLKLSASHNQNKLTAFPGLEKTTYASSFFIGQSVNTAQLLHYQGVDPQTGLYVVEDKNKDGVITNYYNNNNNDLYPKDLSVSLDGGFASDLTYKGLTVNLFFNFRKQITRSAVIGQAPGRITNQPVNVLDRWQKPGDIARFARFTTSSNLSNSYYLYSDGVYSDGSYLRLKNVSISYALPRKWIDRCKMSGLSLFIHAQNLFIVTRYNGIDPDAPALGGLPPQKIFTGGIQVTF
jgi:TonB-linked SusC/RagA family outer membrane protein